MALNEKQYGMVAEYYALHRSDLMAFASVACGLGGEAEDALHDVFLRLLDSERPLSAATLHGLVHAMVRNVAIDRWRHRSLERQHERYVKAGGIHDNVDDRLSVYSPGEIDDLLERGMAQLTPSQSRVYRLNVLGGMQVSEISDRLGEKYKSVEHRLGKARKLMRGYMARMLA